MNLKAHQKVSVALYILSVVISFIYSALSSPPNTYFSTKGNVFNVFFIKKGWFWVTVVYGCYVYFILNKQWSSQQITQSIYRFACATLYWYVMTQWFLGPSFIDRVYVATGGSCAPLSVNGNDGLTTQQQQLTLLLSQTFRQWTCRQLGGKWSGGHDVSGHCVMLIHASLFLWEELSWLFYSIPAAIQLKRSQPSAWYSLLVVFSLLVLWWWMLVMTAIYFHGHFELLSGTVFGILGWVSLYLGLFPNLSAIGLPPQSLYLDKY
ncbi:unnamed protein product [Absidia cylindrospora]